MASRRFVASTSTYVPMIEWARGTYQPLSGKSPTLKHRRLDAMTPDERAAFDQTYDATRLALEVGEKVRDAREAAGLSQRDLAARMGTSQAAVARLEAGGVGATLTTLRKVAAALDLKITVDLSAAS